MGTTAIQSKRDRPLSMVDALFSKKQQQVLALLFGQPDKSFYTNEIIEKSGGGSGAVQRELSRLVRSGLATVERIGNQNHYQANPEAPIFEELRGIMRKTIGLVEPLREALNPFIEQIASAFVFGSVAKKKDSAFSDIDLMILSEALTYGDVFSALENVSQQLERKIQPTIYSRNEWNKRKESDNSFVRGVIEQPKIWILGKENDLVA